MYAINHKTGPGTKALTCVDRFTNQTCTSFPRALTSVNGNAGTGSGDIYVNNKPTHVVVGSKIYYGAQRSTDYGIGCWDTVTNTSCGYKLLASPLNVGSGDYMVRGAGPVLVGTRMFSTTDQNNVYCVDVATFNTCTTGGTWPKDNGIKLAGVPAYAGGGSVATVPRVPGVPLAQLFNFPGGHFVSRKWLR